MSNIKIYKNQWDHLIIKDGRFYTFSDGENPSHVIETKLGKLVEKADHPYFGETVKELLEGYHLEQEG